ncbi:hypothetical protein SLE2022_196140 [Rubroshorea leprosula]
MELLQPSHPIHHGPLRDPISGFTPTVRFGHAVDTMLTSRLSEIVEDGCGSREKERVCVAVGKSVEKAASLLRWTFQQFGVRDVCLLHVHQPSPLIPTLLGKLPASQANEEVVYAYRNEEKEKMKKLLENYMSICGRIKVKASVITTEADQVHKGIIELVEKHGVRKLVMGAMPENCMRIKKSSSKASYIAKYAPWFCEIWFVNKGKNLWTREATEEPSLLPFGQADIATSPIEVSKSLQCDMSNTSIHTGSFRSNSATSSITLPSDSDSKDEEESLNNQLREVRLEAEASKNEAFSELLKCKKVEIEAMEAVSRLKFFESAHAHEVKLRMEAEEALRTTVNEQEKLVEEKEELERELQKTLRNIALLDSHAQEVNSRCDETARELKLILASIATLQQEKQKIRRQKMEAVRWLERWRSRGDDGTANCDGFMGLVEDLPGLAEFSLADLQTATCNFSDSFKIGKGGHGCVYKGEMLGRTVAIKKLNPTSMQGQSEFQQEVQVLSKLQHPHLVTLLGLCPEAWSLVYEYLPNGSLQDRLFQKSNISPLTWKIRARIVAEISSALCFLHSSKPEKIVHGDLKPENILLDSKLSCKICDFGICRLVTEESLFSPSFRRISEPRGAFPYTDPEFYRIGVLTPKSDIYAFGLIILQLLTGKPPVGLASEVRKAVSSGKLTSILDKSAGEWPSFVARRLADLGLQCCELYSRDRPDLKPSVVRELEQLHISEERPVPSFFVCPILQEIMHDPQVAADGFTYEGEALRGWFENGRETSPMTNLKLPHLNLTPNHALRFAIQDWLCRS